jgi:hypothetical protein
MGSNLQVTLSLIDNFTTKLTGIESRLGEFGSRIQRIDSVLMRFGLGLGIGAAGFKVKDTIEDLIKEAKEYSAVHNQLRESLGYTSIELDKQVDIMQDRYKIDDDEVTKSQQQLSLYVQNEAGLKALTEATVQYAAAKRKDLGEATQVIIRAIESEKGSVRGLPDALSGVAGSMERVASVTSTLNEYFHGQAEAIAATKTGWDSLKLSIGDVKKGLAVGLFGGAEDKDFLLYKYAKEMIENTTKAEMQASVTLQANYESQLKVVEEYEKKIADAKKAAQETQGNKAGKELNLMPGFKDKKAYQDAAKKAEEEERQDERDLYHQYLTLVHKTEDDEVEYQKKQIEEKKRLRQQYLTLVHKTEDDEVEYQKKQIEEKERLSQQYLALVRKDEDDLLQVQENKRVSQEKGQQAYFESVNATMSENAGRLTDIATELGTGIGESLGSGIGKGEAGAKEALKGILMTVVSFIEREALAAATKNIFDKILTAPVGAGSIGLAMGIAETAGIVGLAEAAKLAINSFSMGTRFAPGGPSFLHKDEAVFLPRGASVSTASETRQLTNNNGHTFHISLYDSSGSLVDTVATQIRAGHPGTDRLLHAIASRIGK